jgi:hypothetical protein
MLLGPGGEDGGVFDVAGIVGIELEGEEGLLFVVPAPVEPGPDGGEEEEKGEEKD